MARRKGAVLPRRNAPTPPRASRFAPVYQREKGSVMAVSDQTR